MGFDDVKAIGAKVGLEACMLGEELLILGGNTSVGLGTTPTPSLAPSTSGGSAHRSGEPLQRHLRRALARRHRQRQHRRRHPGRDHAQQRRRLFRHFRRRRRGKSANATASISSGTSGSIAATVAPVNGALGYAWFWGAAGSEVLGAITTINSLVITANAAGTQTAASLGSSDNSTNALVFDGLLYQAFKSGSNAYVAIASRPAPPAPARR